MKGSGICNHFRIITCANAFSEALDPAPSFEKVASHGLKPRNVKIDALTQL
jgi:hypothetical protein